jgi:uncharacterized membrane protein
MPNPFHLLRTESAQAWLIYAALMSVCLVWLGVIFAPPLLIAQGHQYAALALYQGLSGICHQIPSRSFQLHGFPLAVCSRCTGLYAGVAMGAMLHPFVRRFSGGGKLTKFWLALAFLPMLVDFSVGYLGIRENSFVSRTATGALAGAAAALYLLPELMTMASPAVRQFSFKEQNWL